MQLQRSDVEGKHSQKVRWSWLLRPDSCRNHEVALLHQTLKFVTPEPARSVRAARCRQQRCLAGGASLQAREGRELTMINISAFRAGVGRARADTDGHGNAPHQGSGTAACGRGHPARPRLTERGAARPRGRRSQPPRQPQAAPPLLPPHLHAQQVLGQFGFHLPGHGGPQAAADPRARVEPRPRTPREERGEAAARLHPPAGGGRRHSTLPTPAGAARGTAGTSDRNNNFTVVRGEGDRGCEQDINPPRYEMVHW